MDFVVATTASIVFLGVSWLYARTVRAGQPLTAIQRKMIFYGFFFVLGMAYLMMLGGNFQWEPRNILSLLGVWGCVIGVTAFFRYRREKRTRSGPDVHLSG